MGFFLTVVLEGLEYKYNMTLDRGEQATTSFFIQMLNAREARYYCTPIVHAFGSSYIVRAKCYIYGSSTT